MENGHKPAAAAALLTPVTGISCTACGSPMQVTANFCPECGVPRASLPAPVTEDTTMTSMPREAEVATTAPMVDENTEAITYAELADVDGGSENPTLPFAAVDTAGEAPTDEGSAAGHAARPRFAPRRTYVLIALVVLAGVAYGGFTLWQAMNRRPVVAALAAASSEFDDAVGTVAQAEGLEELSSVAEDLPGWLRTIQDQRDSLETLRATPLKSATVEVVDAQMAYLSALRPLADLDEDSLSDWPPMAEAMWSARDALDQAGEALVSTDPAARTDLIVDAAAATTAVETSVALASADNATEAVERVIADVQSAKKLAAVREGAQSASQAAEELQAALTTLEGLPDAEVTTALVALQAIFLDELASLESLDEDTLGSWPAMSTRISDAGNEMVEGMDRSAAATSTLLRDLRDLQGNVDSVVSSGKRRLRNWREDVEKAEAARDTELAALAAYESGYRTHMERYNDLRDSTADFTERIREDYGVTYDEAYTVFYDGISQREDVREAMNALSPPDAVRANHLAVVSVIDGAIAAMQAAVDGLADSQFCYFDCYYEDTAGWQRFQEESDRITDDFAAATSSWDDAISARRTELEHTVLPKKPEI